MKMRKDTERKILLIDEAWSLLSRAEDSEYIFEIVKTCRKFNMGLLLINQEVGGLLKSEAGKSVLANSAYTLLMRQKPAVIDEVCKAFHLSETERKYPTLSCDNKIHMKSHYLAKAIKDAEIFSNDVTMCIKGEYYIIESKGAMGSTQTIIELNNEDIVISSDVKDGSISSYDAGNFLDDFIKVADKQTNVTVQFSTDYPIALRFFFEPDNDNTYVEYLLAPRRSTPQEKYVPEGKV